MSEQVLDMLIEGFDPQEALKVKTPEEEMKQAWLTVFGSRQNGTILQADLVSVEETKYTTASNDKKLCGIVHVGHIKGLIPIDFLGVNNDEKAARNLIGSKVAFVVAAIARENEVFVGNRQTAMDNMARITLQRIKVGSTILAVVRSIGNSSMVVDIGGISCRMQTNEISHGYVDSLRHHYKEGQHLNVKVKAIDEETKKVDVSIKDLLPDYWSQIHKYLSVNETYMGTVSGITEFGTFIEFKDGVSGLSDHLRHVKLERGDRVLARILNIRSEEKKINAKIVKVMK